MRMDLSTGFRIRLVVLAFVITLTITSGWCSPRIVVDEEVYNYGVVYEDTQDLVSHTYTLINDGTDILEIKDIKPSCGCTKAEITRKKIPPGESAELTAELKVTAREGRKRIRVTVFTNDPDRDRVELGLDGEVIRRWYVYPTYIDAGVIVTSQTTARQIRFTSQRLPGEPLPEILSADADNPALLVRLEKNPKVADRPLFQERTTQALIEITASDSPQNDVRGQIVFHTNDPNQPTFTIPVRWIVEGDLSLSPRSLHLVRSRYQLGGPETMEEKFSNRRSLPRDSGLAVVSSRSNSSFKILSATVPEPFDVFLSEEPSAAQAGVLVSLKHAPPGSYTGTLAITTDRPEEQTLVATLSGEVQQQAPFLTTPSTLGHFSPVFADEVPAVSKTFVLRNSGSLPLNLVLQNSSGGEARLSRSKLEPSATATLILAADLRGERGMVEVQVVVRTNDPLSPLKTFSLRGRVLPRWETLPEKVQFRNVREGKEEMRPLIVRQFFPSWGSPARIVESRSETGEFRLEPGQTRTVHGNLGYSTAETDLTVRLVPTGPVGPNEGETEIRTEEECKFTPPHIRITWEVMGDLAVRPRSLILDDLPGMRGASETGAKRVRIYSRGKNTFAVTKVDSPDGIEVAEIETKPGEIEYEVRVTDESRFVGLEGGSLVFHTNRFEEPSLVVPLIKTAADPH